MLKNKALGTLERKKRNKEGDELRKEENGNIS